MSLSLNVLYAFDEFQMDRARRALLRNGVPVALSSKSFDVLTYLVLHPGRVVTKEELLKGVWPESFVEEGNLAQHISSLRKALGDRATLIVTVPGRGYQFASQVEEQIEGPRIEGPRGVANRVSQPDIQMLPGDLLLQRVRERTHVVIEESTASSPAEPTVPLPAAARSSWRRWGLVGLATAIAIGAAAAYRMRVVSATSKMPKVAIADFLNLTGDPEFDRTLKSATLVSLGQSPYIQPMGSGEEHTTLTMMEKAPDTPLLGDVALEVCRRGGYQALLRGRISKLGTTYELGMELVNCASGKLLATFRGTAWDKDRVLGTLDQLVTRARGRLGEDRDSIAQFDVPIYEATTFSFEALQDFDTGSDLGNAGKLKECIAYFQKAADLDPKFAMAQASLGTAYFNLGDAETARKYYKKAFDLSAGVSQSEKVYIRSNYYLAGTRDLEGAERSFAEGTRLYPLNESLWGGLADVATQLADYPTAVKAAEQALKVAANPTAISYELLARAYKRVNRFADAKRTIAEAEAQGKDGPDLHEMLFDIAVIEQDTQSIQREIAWNKNQPQLYQSLEGQALYAADQGKWRQAEDLFRLGIEAGRKEVSADYADAMLVDEAKMELELGRIGQAKQMLGQVKDRNSASFAVTSAAAGDVSAATRWLQEPIEYPDETVVVSGLRPEMKALVALHRGDAAQAIRELELPPQYKLLSTELIALRGEAYLAAQDGFHAQAEFQRLIDDPALDDPTLPRTYAAHLGLGRAYLLQGKKAESKAEYERLFALWKDADEGLPLLATARQEYQRAGF